MFSLKREKLSVAFDEAQSASSTGFSKAQRGTGTGDKREARVGDDGNDGRAPLRPSFPL